MVTIQFKILPDSLSNNDKEFFSKTIVEGITLLNIGIVKTKWMYQPACNHTSILGRKTSIPAYEYLNVETNYVMGVYTKKNLGLACMGEKLLKNFNSLLLEGNEIFLKTYLR